MEEDSEDSEESSSSYEDRSEDLVRVEKLLVERSVKGLRRVVWLENAKEEEGRGRARARRRRSFMEPDVCMKVVGGVWGELWGALC